MKRYIVWLLYNFSLLCCYHFNSMIFYTNIIKIINTIKLSFRVLGALYLFLENKTNNVSKMETFCKL